MTEPTRLICAPWVSLPDLPVSRPRLAPEGDDAGNDDAWEALCWQASELLYGLSGRQFSGGCASTVELRTHRPQQRGLVAEAVFGSPVGAVGELGSPGSFGMAGRAWGRRGAAVAALPGRPVTSITEVTVDGEPVDASFYEADLPAGLLWRADGCAWPDDGSVLVTYTHGRLPDVGGVQAARTMTLELGKAARNEECRLPKRMQSITREGVSVNFASTFESLAEGRTGIWEVDSWLAAVNKHGFTAPPSVFSPDAVRGRRRVQP